jgi:membrane protease YdiL (CAAX protease family)
VHVPLWVFAAGLLVYAAFNAAFEEALFRGLFMARLEDVGTRTIALGLQAVAFGSMHYRGFPSGVVGVALALVFGAMMGHLRVRSGGLLVPFAAHVVADVTIFVLVAAMVFGS